jgi:hypothetical protein
MVHAGVMALMPLSEEKGAGNRDGARFAERDLKLET